MKILEFQYFGFKKFQKISKIVFEFMDKNMNLCPSVYEIVKKADVFCHVSFQVYITLSTEMLTLKVKQRN